MPEKSENEGLILIGVGIIISAALIFLAMRKQLFQPQAPAVQTASLYKQDVEFIKWYTENIIKPSIQQAARESADNAIKQFMDLQLESNSRTEIQTLGPKISKPKARPGNWVITRDSEGAIMSIETDKEIKESPQKQPKHQIPTIKLIPGRSNITHDA